MDSSGLSDPGGGSSSSILADLNDRLISTGVIKRPLKFTSLLGALFEGERSVQDETGKKVRRESVERELESLCKALSGMMGQKKSDLLQLESLSASRQVLQYDHDRMSSKYTKLQRSVLHLEKDKETLRAQVIASDQKVKRQEIALKAARDEAIRSRAALSGLRTQYTHELKKKELEREKIMQGWQKLANEGARTNSWTLPSSRGHQGLLLLNPIQGQAQGPRADTFWDPSIADLEMKIDNLREECEAFRHVTLSTGHQIQEVLGAIEEQDIPRVTSSTFFSLPTSSSSSSSRSQAQQAASSITHPKAADARLRDLVHQLKRRVEEVSDERREAVRAKEDWRRDLDGLLEGERVQRVREVLESRIKEMQAQLEAALQGVPPATPPTFDSRDHEREDFEAHERRSELLATAAAEKQALENERRQFAEVMIRLGNEKALFEAEKATFEEAARARQLEQELRERELQAKIDEVEARAAAASAIATAEANARAESGSLSPAEEWFDTPEAAPPAASMDANGHQVGPKIPTTNKAAARTKPSTGTTTMFHASTSAAATSRSRPAVSSPLRGSQSRMLLSSSHRSPSGGKRTASGASSSSSAMMVAAGGKATRAGHRIAKGPATPLARYVTHKLVAEKLATAKKQQQQQQHRQREQIESASTSATKGQNHLVGSENISDDVQMKDAARSFGGAASTRVEESSRPRPLGATGTLANRGTRPAGTTAAPAATIKERSATKQQQTHSATTTKGALSDHRQGQAAAQSRIKSTPQATTAPIGSRTPAVRPQRPR